MVCLSCGLDSVQPQPLVAQAIDPIPLPTLFCLTAEWVVRSKSSMVNESIDASITHY